jgi:hypothetical protein
MRTKLSDPKNLRKGGVDVSRSRSQYEHGDSEDFETVALQRACTYKVRLEDVGYCMRCECIVSDVFGRVAEPVSCITPPVGPGLSNQDSSVLFSLLFFRKAALCLFIVWVTKRRYVLNSCVFNLVFGAGLPRIDKLEVEGRGYHTSLYAVRGIYFGGSEGKSTLQWFRAMAGSPDLIPINGTFLMKEKCFSLKLFL